MISDCSPLQKNFFGKKRMVQHEIEKKYITQLVNHRFLSSVKNKFFKLKNLFVKNIKRIQLKKKQYFWLLKCLKNFAKLSTVYSSYFVLFKKEINSSCYDRHAYFIYLSNKLRETEICVLLNIDFYISLPYWRNM